MPVSEGTAPRPSDDPRLRAAAEIESIAGSVREGADPDALEGRMRRVHDAVLALGREANQGRATSIALLIAALRAGAPPHPGMAEKLLEVAADLRQTAAREPG
jgi:hypothetical protein